MLLADGPRVCPAGAMDFKEPLLLLLRGGELCRPGRALQVSAAG